MNIEELAQVFDGLVRGFASGLKEKEKKELAALVDMFRRFPNQGVSDFIRFVDGAFSKEQNSIPALVERIRLFKQGSGEPRQQLEASLTRISAVDLKKLVAALGLKPGSKKDVNLKLLQSHLGYSQTDPSDASRTSVDVVGEVDRAYKFYESIKAELRSISIDEMKARFANLSVLPKPVLAGVLSKLGYSADGSKEEIEAKLLDNLTSIKISHDQTKQIGT
ncbi:MAG: hypothetical protein NZM29_05695 [Nitrospira sp.]|nr:hypothetical protein [Nitrospira sp.]